MKLAPAEAKAIKFVLALIALSVFARWSRRPEPIAVEQSRSVPAAEASAVVTSGPRRSRTQALIDPNRATVSELDKLPGIGQATAQKIIAQRPYQTLDDLARVIGRKRAQALAKRLTISGTAGAAGSARNDPGSTDNNRALINLNNATQSELETISGVGPNLAMRLRAARDSLGGFRRWSQVDSVSGVGPALLRKLKAAATL